MISPADIMVTGLLAIAVFTDLKWGKVHNVLTFSGMSLGLVAHLFLKTPLESLLGIIVAFIPVFALWKLGKAIKGGDAKLFMAVGAIIGPWEVTRLLLITFLVNIPVALIQLAIAGRLKNFFKVIKAGVKQDQKGPKPMLAPFAAVIGVAFLISKVFPMFMRFWS